MSEPEEPRQSLVMQVKAPGERYDGTFRELYQEMFGVTDEAMALVGERIRERMKLADIAERQARINGRNIILGITALN